MSISDSNRSSDPHPRLMLVVGSGGVGKTSISAAVAISLARAGHRVLVLTVDPSLRLQKVLQFSQSSKAEKLGVPGTEHRLFGMRLDPKNIFDSFVVRLAGSAKKAERILNNRLYQELSTNLAGSQEFAALQKLKEVYESSQYDWVILDTPPAQHAFEFLTAPKRLNSLFKETLLSFFQNDPQSRFSLFRSLVGFGTNRIWSALGTLTGSDFLRELREFFLEIRNWQTQLRDSLNQIEKILLGPHCDFLLVSGPGEMQLKEAETLAQRLSTHGCRLKFWLVNRSWPMWIDSFETFDPESNWARHHSVDEGEEFLRSAIRHYLGEKQALVENIKKMSSTLGPLKIFAIPSVDSFASELDKILEMSTLLGLKMGLKKTNLDSVQS